MKRDPAKQPVSDSARSRLCSSQHALAEIPQYLLESQRISGQIAITQPRRVAATSLAARVSMEQARPLGTLVGYAVRFDECSSPKTRVKYLTDGMLVREMMIDPLLGKYGVVVVDEAHERTLRTDLVLASLKKILRERNGGVDGKGKAKAKANPLKVVVMSATLDAEKFSKFFDKCVAFRYPELDREFTRRGYIAPMCCTSGGVCTL